MTDLPEFNNANFYATRDPFEAVAGKQGDMTPVGFYRGKHYTEPAIGPV